jgi:small-conductance mechanosensitive channel
MLTSQVPTALTNVTTRVQRNQHGRVIEGALALASQFHAWADALSEAKQKAKEDPSSQEGSGESPGKGNEKIMLSLMRLLQREMTLRDQTRAADALKEDAAHHAQVAAGLAADQRDIAFSVASLLARLMDPNLQQRLRGAAEAMDDAAALLERADTGGETIAAETDAIERLAQAAKASGQMGGQSKTVNALAEVLAMMEVGNSPGGNDSGESSSLASRASEGAMGEDGREARTIGKTSGRVAGDFPEEFREALGHFFEAREALRTAPPQP